MHAPPVWACGLHAEQQGGGDDQAHSEHRENGLAMPGSSGLSHAAQVIGVQSQGGATVNRLAQIIQRQLWHIGRGHQQAR